MSDGFPDDWRNKIVAWAALKDDVQAIYLFGSSATGTHKRESDVDLAIVLAGEDFGARFGFWVFAMDAWKAELSRLLGVGVDLQMADQQLDEMVSPAVVERGRLLYRQRRG